MERQGGELPPSKEWLRWRNGRSRRFSSALTTASEFKQPTAAEHCSPEEHCSRTIGQRSRAIQPIAGRIGSAAGEGNRRGEAAPEQELKGVDRVRDIDSRVVIRIAGVVAGNAVSAGDEELGEEKDCVRDVQGAAAVAIGWVCLLFEHPLALCACGYRYAAR